MTSRRSGSRVRGMIFGPAPILQKENSAAYELLLERHYTDVKPKDIAEESYVHDGAYWNWELRRLRRMKICLIEAATADAMVWVFAMPHSARLRYIRGTKDVDVRPDHAQALHGHTAPQQGKPGSVSSDELSEEAMQIRVNELKENFGLIDDTITTRAFLEQLDLLERIDQMIVVAESRRNAAYREIHRHRAALNYEKREKTRIIDDAEFKVIKLGKHRAKRDKKNAA